MRHPRFRSSAMFDNQADSTHPKYSRIIRHLRLRCRLLFRLFLNPQVFDITTAEYDVLVDVVLGRYFVARASALGAEGLDLLKGDCGVFGADFVKGADIAGDQLTVSNDSLHLCL